RARRRNLGSCPHRQKRICCEWDAVARTSSHLRRAERYISRPAFFPKPGPFPGGLGPPPRPSKTTAPGARMEGEPQISNSWPPVLMETSKAASRDSIDEKASSFDFLLIAPTGLSNWGAYDELTWPETVVKFLRCMCDRLIIILNLARLALDRVAFSCSQRGSANKHPLCFNGDATGEGPFCTARELLEAHFW